MSQGRIVSSALASALAHDLVGVHPGNFRADCSGALGVLVRSREVQGVSG